MRPFTPRTIKERYTRSFIIAGAMGAAGLAAVAGIGELDRYFQWGHQALGTFWTHENWPPLLLELISMVIPASLILGIVQAAPAVLVWWERKVAAHMQQRLGPMYVGGWHGWAQTIADAIKLTLKQDITPEGSDRWVHRLAPVIAFIPAYVCFAPIPFGRSLAAVNLDTGLLFVLSISGLSVIGLLMAGWGSANKYSLLGGLRAAAQVVSYEVPRVLSVVPVVMWAGTLSLSRIAEAQSQRAFGLFPKWFIFYPVVGQIAFVIYLISTVAETNRTPFDIAEAESELVAGFHTEYSGIKFAFFFLAEYAYVFLGSALGAVLFLGGGDALPGLGWIPSWTWLLGKTMFLVFFFLWFRWTYPRLRVDRLMEFCWKFLVPWSFANIALLGFVMTVVRH